jgi:phage terminase large subunit-like protein
LDEPAWSEAQRREVIIRAVLSGNGSMTARTDSAANALGLSARSVRRLVVRYKASAPQRLEADGWLVRIGLPMPTM